MASGIGAGLVGFAEGFSKAFTDARTRQRERDARKDAFVVEQLLTGAQKNPAAAVKSPEFNRTMENYFGKQRAGTINEFLTKLGKDMEGDTAEAFLTQPAPGQEAAPQAQATPQAAPVGTGTVLAPSPEAQMIAPQRAATPAAPATVSPTFVDAQGQAWDTQGNPVEASAEATPTAPPQRPKTRAELIQERLPPGATFTQKFPGGKTVTLPSKAGEVQGWQDWFATQSNNPQLTPQEAAMTTVQNLTQRGMAPPKELVDLAMRPIGAEADAQAAALKEKHLRDIGFKFPETPDEFRASIAKGLFPGSYFVGRDLKDTDLNTAKVQGYVIQTYPSGDRIAVPRNVATLNNLPTVDPQDLIHEAEVQKFAAKSGQAKQAAQAFLKILDRAKPGFELLLPGPKSFAGAATDYLRARTTLQAKLFTLRRQGDARAKGLAGLSSGATPYVKAFFEVGAITKDDRKGYEDIAGNIARGYASRPEAEAADAWMRAIIQELHTVQDPKKARENVGGLDMWVEQAEAAAETGAATPGTATTTTQQPQATTSTTLPMGARIVEENGKRYIEYPD